MNCHTVRKYLHLYRQDELTAHERLILEEHIQTCKSCKELSNEIDEYEHILKKLRNKEPLLGNSLELTDTIIDAISFDKQGGLNTTIKVLRLPFMRIAVSLLILVQLGFFSYQQYYILYSVSKLHINNYEHSNQKNQDAHPSNKECIEQSKKIISDVLANEDDELRNKAFAISKELYGFEIEHYAVKICQHSDLLAKSKNKEKKKELLLTIFKNEFNPKL